MGMWAARQHLYSDLSHSKLMHFFISCIFSDRLSSCYHRHTATPPSLWQTFHDALGPTFILLPCLLHALLPIYLSRICSAFAFQYEQPLGFVPCVDRYPINSEFMLSSSTPA